MTVDTIVLAGGKNSPAMSEATQTDVRALVSLGTKPMLDFVIDALVDAPSIGRIVVIGDVPANSRYQQIAPGETLMDNLYSGLDALGPPRADTRTLVSTSDIPFLTPASIEDFLAQAHAADADFCYPIIPIDLCRTHFPQMKRTTLRIREGEFTGGNLMLVNPAFMRAQRVTLARAYAARKHPVRLGAMLGWSLLARLLLAQTVSPSSLSMAMLEEKVSRLLGSGCRAHAIVSHFPEIGTDIDSPQDIATARTLLAASPVP